MRTKRRSVLHRGRQSGASFIFTLMAMVVLAFAALALTRSIDTGTMIMGNLSFRQDTVQSSSVAAERAITWLQQQVTGTALDNDQAASGYYASTPARLDPTGHKTSSANPYSLVDWDGNGCADVPAANRLTCNLLPFTDATVNGNAVRYVILRLCSNQGPSVGGNACMIPATSSSSANQERGELQPGGRISTTSASPYYQIIVRTTGPRNTVSFTETLVHF